MFKTILLTSFITFCLALSKIEIENIRRELNDELTKLEVTDTKKTVHKKQTVSLDDLLADFTKAKKSDQKRANNNNILQKQRAEDALEDLLIKEENRKRSEKRVSDKTIQLWDMMTMNRNKNQNQNLEFTEMFNNALNKQLTKKSAAGGDNFLKNFLNSGAPQKKSTDTETLLKFLEDDMSNKRSANEPEKECRDNRKDCDSFEIYCDADGYKERMTELCPLTCKVCKVCKKDIHQKCKIAAKSGFCKDVKYKETMKKLCYETCGYCRVPSPPACQNHVEGCCWDKRTFVKDGCPPCEDASNVKRLCKSLIDECKNEYTPGKWMKKNCPVTCEFCNPQKDCRDHKNFGSLCKKWKKEGKCKEDETREICSASCNACEDRYIKINNV